MERLGSAHGEVGAFPHQLGIVSVNTVNWLREGELLRIPKESQAQMEDIYGSDTVGTVRREKEQEKWDSTECGGSLVTA